MRGNLEFPIHTLWKKSNVLPLLLFHMDVGCGRLKRAERSCDDFVIQGQYLPLHGSMGPSDVCATEEDCSSGWLISAAERFWQLDVADSLNGKRKEENIHKNLDVMIGQMKA